jgi:hypothetical protein
MDLQKFAFPALAFAVGAVLGRIFGLKPLMRGAMTAAAVTGFGSRPALLETRPAVRRSRKPTHRAAHKRSAHKKSPRVAAAHQ